MRKLVAAIIVLPALWGGYWFVGSSAVERGLTMWLSERQDDGWVANYSDLNTRGFPNRFDTTITDLELADTTAGVAWKVPFFQIFAISYKPNHIIAVWPNEQTFATPYETISIESSEIRASVVFEPGTSLTLDRSNFNLAGIQMSSTLGWTAGIESGGAFTRQTVGKENTHDILFQANGMRPSADVLARIDPAKLLPDIFDSFLIDATLAFDAPWDRHAIERNRPQITNIDLKKLSAIWGKLDLQAAGQLSVDANGVPEGQISVKAKNWRTMLQIGVDTGVVPTNISKTLENALEFLAELSGNPKTLDAPLTFRGGRVSFGPIPLGPAPRFVLR